MRFLIVDDHPIFLAGARVFLEEAFPHASCVTCDSGRGALAEIDRGQHFDLILADINMPDIGGLALVKAIAARGLRTKVLLMSAAEDRRAVAGALRDGASGFVSKSLKPEIFADYISAVLAGGKADASLLSPSSAVALGEPPLPEAGAREGRTPALPARRREILQLLAKGMSNKDIGLTLNIAEPTVKTHVSSLFRNFGVSNRTACVARARALRMLG